VSPNTETESRGFRGSRRGRAGLSILTALLVFLVALGANRSLARVSPTHSLLDIRSIIGDVFIVVLGLMFAGLCLLAYALLASIGRSRSGKEEEDHTRPSAPWWAKLLTVFLLLATLGGVVAAILLSDGNGSTNPLDSLTTPTLLPLDTGSVPAGGPANFVVHWWILAALALVALCVFVFVILLRRSRGDELEAEPGSTKRDELRAAVEASLEELEEEHDPRQAVIHAYASMERVLSEHGLRRKPSETHIEYLTRWVTAVQVTRPAAEALTVLYERARFSLHVVDEQMKRDARAALLALRRELQEGAR
jgi:hypothetical protein